MDDNDGIALGRHYDDATQGVGSKIPYQGERHLLLFGPNGTGKGTRFLIPNLLAIKDRSIVVVDPKGELAAVTAEYRRTVNLPAGLARKRERLQHEGVGQPEGFGVCKRLAYAYAVAEPVADALSRQPRHLAGFDARRRAWVRWRDQRGVEQLGSSLGS